MYGRVKRGDISRARPEVAQKLGAVIRSQKTGVAAPLTALRAGKIDRTRVARLGCKDLRVFKAQAKPAPSKVKCIVLLDASGSMAGYEATIAVQLGRDFIEMSLLNSNIELEVWAHTSGRTNNAEGMPEHSIDIYPLWKAGLAPTKVNRYLQIPFRGNEDGWALAAIGDRLAEICGPRDTGIVVVVSDGAPAYSTIKVDHDLKGAERWTDADHANHVLSHVRSVAEGIRARGHAVISVSVSRGLDKETQIGMYGKDSVIPYQHNMTLVARQIGLAIGRQFNR